MINFSFTAVIINSVVDNYWPDALGDIRLKYILLAHVKEQFIFALVCNTVYAGQLFITNEALCYGHRAGASNVLH